jgi:hypothetical protein
MSNADAIYEQFRYRQPTAEKSAKHQEARALIIELATDLDPLIPAGREKALVWTKLEEALFWINAAIARQD